MNKEHLNYLRDSLKFLGFGEKVGLLEQLEQTIEKEPNEFCLSTESDFGERYKMQTVLYFRRAEEPEIYFFNRYDALLMDKDDPDQDRGQTFYVNKGTGFTFKEAFNLLQGRAVNKELADIEGRKYNAWVQLNFEEKDLHNNYKFRQWRTNYGYDLEKVLAKYPIKEWQNDQLKIALIKSLKKGNQHVVTFVKEHKREMMLIEANPKYKTVNLYPVKKWDSDCLKERFDAQDKM